MWYQIISYIKHYFRATNKHGLHSPFVYNLVTQCFFNTTKHSEYLILKKYRNTLLQSEQTIEVTDFGAGSRVFKTNERSVAAIAKNAGVTSKRQRLLFRLTHYLKPKLILELGTSLGLGTSALAMGNFSAKVVTLEGCPNTSEKAKNMFNVFDLKNIQLKNETFEDYFRNNTTQTYDLVYIDGNHSKEKTLEYFEILLNKVHNDSVLIFDDIYWSPAMTQAWEKIIAHPKVSVSIDTFQWGLVFFRKEQEKEHFRIRL